MLKNEQWLKESQKRFQVMADFAPVMIWVADTNRHCTYFNKPWLNFRGRTLDQECGKDGVQGIHPEDYQRYQDVYETSFNARRGFQMEYRLMRYDGIYCWILDTGSPLINEEGGFEGYIGSCVDITDRKRAETSLHEAYQKVEVSVEERTQELAKANKALQVEILVRKHAEKELMDKLRELKSLNQVMMDREERILELKAEIKSLKSNLSKISSS